MFALRTPLFLPSGYCTLKCDVRCIECSESRYFIVRKCLVFSKPSRQTPHWITGDSFKCMPATHSHENTNSCIKSCRIFALCAEKHCIYFTSLTTVVLKVGSREPSGFLKKVPNVQSCFGGLYRQDYTGLTVRQIMAGTKSIAAPHCSALRRGKLISHIRI